MSAESWTIAAQLSERTDDLNRAGSVLVAFRFRRHVSHFSVPGPRRSAVCASQSLDIAHIEDQWSANTFPSAHFLQISIVVPVTYRYCSAVDLPPKIRSTPRHVPSSDHLNLPLGGQPWSSWTATKILHLAVAIQPYAQRSPNPYDVGTDFNHDSAFSISSSVLLLRSISLVRSLSASLGQP